MTLLVADVGNTRTHVGLFQGRRLIRRWTHPTRKLPRRWPRADAFAAASVVPAVKLPAKMLGRDFPAAIRNRRRGVGADRLANAAAAWARFRRDCAVVDLGTAVTIDVVRRGEFVGGAIAPGLGLMSQALYDYTALLPKVAPRRVPPIGRTTESNIQSGLYHALRGLIAEMRRHVRGPLIGTGSDAPLFRDLFDALDPDLTLKGIALSWRNATGQGS